MSSFTEYDKQTIQRPDPANLTIIWATEKAEILNRLQALLERVQALEAKVFNPGNF